MSSTQQAALVMLAAMIAILPSAAAGAQRARRPRRRRYRGRPAGSDLAGGRAEMPSPPADPRR